MIHCCRFVTLLLIIITIIAFLGSCIQFKVRGLCCIPCKLQHKIPCTSELQKQAIWPTTLVCQHSPWLQNGCFQHCKGKEMTVYQANSKRISTQWIPRIFFYDKVWYLIGISLQLGAQSSQKKMTPVNGAFSWQSYNEETASSDDSDTTTLEGLWEQVYITRDNTDYLWYLTE